MCWWGLVVLYGVGGWGALGVHDRVARMHVSMPPGRTARGMAWSSSPCRVATGQAAHFITTPEGRLTWTGRGKGRSS